LHAQATAAKKKKRNPGRQFGFSPSAPIAPEHLLNSASQHLDAQHVSIRQKQRFVILVCKYWALKREARRGAPLLKRLHLEVLLCSLYIHSLSALDGIFFSHKRE
jgi:hypothetical protein